MDPKPSKKRYEHFLLDQFLTSLGLSPQDVVERDCPDFLIRVDGKWIGIELTDIHISHQEKGSALRASESISDQIVAKAQQLYGQSQCPPVHVTLCFSPLAPLIHVNRDQIAMALSEFISQLNLSPGRSVNWRPEDDEESTLPWWVSFVHVLGVPSHQMAHWTVARAGWAAELTPSVLQARIDEKSEKLPAYMTVVTENWLVMVANATKPSQLFVASSAFEQNSISSPFSRTFYYSYPGRDLIEF